MTQIEKLELLLGSNAGFDETQLQGFLDITGITVEGTEQLFMAAALACENLATVATAGATSTKMGDYSENFRNQDVSYQTQADRYRNLVYNTPAFADVEENLSDFNTLAIIRNFVLRTETI